MKKKVIIIINGKGESGKDTLIDGLAEHQMSIINVSSIDPIKEILKNTGYWDGVTKDDKTRKCLSQLKDAFTEYNELPMTYLQGEIKSFIDMPDSFKIMFIHIREPKNIYNMKQFIKDTYPDIPVYTMLVYRDGIDCRVYGNPADDEVNEYVYDYRFYNCMEIKESQFEFYNLIKEIYKQAIRNLLKEKEEI